MRNVLRVTLMIMFIFILTTYQSTWISIAQPIVSIQYYIHYDPVYNTGILEITVQLGQPSGLEPPYELVLPVDIFEEGTELYFVNYTVTNIKTITLDYDSQTRTVRAIYEGPGTLKIYFAVDNIMESQGPENLVLYLDLTRLEQLTNEIRVDLVIPGVYKVENTTLQGNISISARQENDVTRITISGLGELIAVLIAEETTIPGPTTPLFTNLTWILILIIIVIFIAILFIYILRRKSRGVEIETIDFTQDEVSRLIIKTLKESGNKGLTQAEITKQTGLPKSSISRRIRRLEEEGYIEVKRVGKYNYVYLTNKGLELAKKTLGKD